MTAPAVDSVQEPAFTWHDGGAERMIWTSADRRWWASVWPDGDRYGAWVSGVPGRQVSAHGTECDAVAWCEDLLRAVLQDPTAIAPRAGLAEPLHGA